MPIIQVTLLEGRSRETKQRLIDLLTQAAIDAVGAPRENVRVMIWEIPPENFAVGGQVKPPPVLPGGSQ
ncbi:2-hydroxymuconate tautomerase [Variovorax sp. KK3]|uniref:2-hydroxymuconate tautomerase n=1 Tax=Variovorax sp. KK3 TaxID=1855728 RepID=UPI00097C35E2|nr:2-hydroxymuconate tautomerase [Variovorax sp. KK3]